MENKQLVNLFTMLFGFMAIIVIGSGLYRFIKYLIDTLKELNSPASISVKESHELILSSNAHTALVAFFICGIIYIVYSHKKEQKKVN